MTRGEIIGAGEPLKRVASAVGEGSMAVRLVHQRLASGWPGSPAR